MNKLCLPRTSEELAERLKFLAQEREKFPRPPRRFSLTAEERESVLKKTDRRCHLCGGEITENKFCS
jgi:hypothetical protein